MAGDHESFGAWGSDPVRRRHEASRGVQGGRSEGPDVQSPSRWPAGSARTTPGASAKMLPEDNVNGVGVMDNARGDAWKGGAGGVGRGRARVPKTLEATILVAVVTFCASKSRPLQLSFLFGPRGHDPYKCLHFLGLEVTILVTVLTLRASKSGSL